MSNNAPMLKVHVYIELSAASIQAVVSNSKKKAGKDEKGRYRVDTADILSNLITKFLQDKNFDEFTQDETNY
jgi:hypothetical protein